MFKSPAKQWENVLTQPLKKQIKFVNKIAKVNRRDALVLRGAFFEDLSFDLVRQIFKLVKEVSKAVDMDENLRDLILDRLLWVSEIAHLYPEDRDAEENIISGEGYHVYSACYYDLDLFIEFINSRDDIKSLCDLGSGSGRALLNMALEVDKELEYLGLELIGERVEFTNSIAQHFELKNLTFKTCNFLEDPDSFLGFDAYYLFDPVGTNDVDLLISYFKKMIDDGAKFYILFVSGWDELMLDALNNLGNLEMIGTNSSKKQENRYVNFYKVVS